MYTLFFFWLISANKSRQLRINNESQFVKRTNNYHLQRLHSKAKRIKKEIISRIFLLGQVWIVNYCVKRPVKTNLSSENIKTGVSRKVFCFDILIHVFEDKGNTSFYVSITEIFWLTFDVIIDGSYLTYVVESHKVTKPK